MTQAVAPPLGFLEFLETTPEDGKRYELVNGERVQLMATRAHKARSDQAICGGNCASGT